MNDNKKTRPRPRFAGPAVLLLPACFCACLAGCAMPVPPQTRAMQPGPSGIQAVPGPTAAPATAPAAAVAQQVPSPGVAASPPAQIGAATPDKPALLRAWVDQQAHLYRVAAPLLINNTELCPRQARNLLGFTAKNRHSYSAAFADTAQAALGLEERLRVMNVLPGSGAEQAGLAKGDTLLAVEIEPLPQGPDAERAGAALIASELQGRNNVSLTVLRNGERMALDIPLTPACAMVIDLGNADFAGSFADGQRIMVTRGMLNQVRSDEELADVLAQEMARNILAEPASPMPEAAALIDRLHTLEPQAVDPATAANLPPVPADIALKARKLALFLLARAGYGIDDAPLFWQRQGNPPMTDADLSALQETIGTIKTKQQAGMPLVPEPS